MARRITPSLADVTQDIAGVIPVDLIKRWTNTKKSQKLHDEILSKYIIEGTVVSTDSSGLSKLSQTMPLIKVMQIVSHPKDLVFKYGTEIGGIAIGIWAADNTQMFYPKNINPDLILEAMRKVQSELNSFTIKIGMAIHYGKFYKIGEGLFGNDANLVEELAENEAEGGEIKLTKEFEKLLSK